MAPGSGGAAAGAGLRRWVLHPLCALPLQRCCCCCCSGGGRAAGGGQPRGTLASCRAGGAGGGGACSPSCGLCCTQLLLLLLLQGVRATVAARRTLLYTAARAAKCAAAISSTCAALRPPRAHRPHTAQRVPGSTGSAATGRTEVMALFATGFSSFHGVAANPTEALIEELESRAGADLGAPPDAAAAERRGRRGAESSPLPTPHTHAQAAACWARACCVSRRAGWRPGWLQSWCPRCVPLRPPVARRCSRCAVACFVGGGGGALCVGREFTPAHPPTHPPAALGRGLWCRTL